MRASRTAWVLDVVAGIVVGVTVGFVGAPSWATGMTAALTFLILWRTER